MRDLNQVTKEIDKITTAARFDDAVRVANAEVFPTHFAVLSDVVKNGFNAVVNSTSVENSSRLIDEFPDETLVWIFRSDSVRCGRGGAVAFLDDERCPEVVAAGIRHCLEEIQGVLTGVKKVPWA